MKHLSVLICLTFLSTSGIFLQGTKKEFITLPSDHFRLPSPLTGLIRPFVHVKNPEADASKKVRFYGATPTISQEEKDFLVQRKTISAAAQSHFLNYPVTKESALTIAIVGSGGGDAAGLYLLHILKALKDIGLFPEATTYLAGISGSTFTMVGIYSSMKPFDVYFQEMRQRAQNGFLTSPITETLVQLTPLLKTITDCTVQRILSSLPPAGVDPYGVILMLHYLGQDGTSYYQNKTLTSQLSAIDRFNYPLPIYQAGIPIKEDGELKMDIIEFNPLRVINYGAQADIPATSFNWPIGSLVGVCGSAVSTPMSVIVPVVISKLKPQAFFKPLKKLFTETSLGEISLFPTYFRNFAENVPQSPYHGKKLLLSADAGISLSIPFIPFVLQAERAIDLFIAVDAGGNVWGSNSLLEIADYCRERGLPFPAVHRCDKTLSTIFKENSPSQAPVVLYFPISGGDQNEIVKSHIAEPTHFKRSVESLNLFEKLTKEQVEHAREELKAVMITLVKEKEKQAAPSRLLKPFGSTASKITYLAGRGIA